MDEKRYTQDSRLIRWAYLWEELKPLNTDTCALFWRSVVLTPLKLAAPVALAGAFLLALAMLIGPYFWPEHTWFAAAAQRRANELPMSAEDWRALALIASAVLAAVIGVVTGFWSWLHNTTCAPVNIEGGMVRKGQCPDPACRGRLILDEDEDWTCQSCKGYFVTGAMRRADEEAGDEQ